VVTEMGLKLLLTAISAVAIPGNKVLPAIDSPIGKIISPIVRLPRHHHEKLLGKRKAVRILIYS
jgi:hypothetical protein